MVTALRCAQTIDSEEIRVETPASLNLLLDVTGPRKTSPAIM
jgi:hypothetical protein